MPYSQAQSRICPHSQLSRIPQGKQRSARIRKHRPDSGYLSSEFKHQTKQKQQQISTWDTQEAKQAIKIDHRQLHVATSYKNVSISFNEEDYKQPRKEHK